MRTPSRWTESIVQEANRRRLRAGSFRWRSDLTLNFASLGADRRGTKHQRFYARRLPICAAIDRAISARRARRRAEPSLVLMPEPYKADLFNFAPNVGVAWTPEREGVPGTVARHERSACSA